jgi:hypothetical protein
MWSPANPRPVAFARNQLRRRHRGLLADLADLADLPDLADQVKKW